ncbi:MAG: copper amine oxidase N-terminal domain-containing protein [Defluviitaleaceae bacterium]|nr:copper amine oxidase N-terminal domain-containing protein [Defluviitaleaceae bacterium]
MKNNFKKIGASMLAATMAFTAAPLAANAASIDPIEVNGWNYEGQEDTLDEMQEFGSFRGNVVEIYENRVRVEQGESAVVFQKNDNTHIWGELNIGDDVTGYWSNFGIMTMQYPPHYNVRLIVNHELGDVTFDRFSLLGSGSFISNAGDRILNISDETPIFMEDGQNAREILEEGQTLAELMDGRLMAVTYSLLDRAWPGGTMPADPSLAVTILFETAVHPIGNISGLDIGGFDAYAPDYTYIEGTVTEIFETFDNNTTFVVERENGLTVHFIQDFLTFVKGDEIAVGDTIQGFYDLNMPIVMIYPPRYTARVIVNKADAEGVTTIITADDEFIATITDDTPVRFAGGEDVRQTLEEGRDFEEVLHNRTLAVTHDEEGNLLSVVVLYVRAVTLPGLVLDLDLDTPIQVEGNPISVEGQLINAQWQEIDGEYYVPLRVIVETLNPNHTIIWDNDSRSIMLNNGVYEVTVTIGSSIVTVGAVDVELPAPALLVESVTYVPFRFFNLAFGVNNAWMHAGQIFIDNQEIMQ